MSESYEVLVLMPEGLPVKNVVYGTHEIIYGMGGCIDDDCLLILNDTEDVSPSIDYISNDEAALNTLVNWSAFGGINYTMPDTIITVEYAGIYVTNLVQAIRITIPDTAFFDESGEESRDRYVSLGKKLHEKFQAKRTIIDWGLLYMGVYWKEEIERLKNREYVGEYFVDMRSSEKASKQGLVA